MRTRASRTVNRNTRNWFVWHLLSFVFPVNIGWRAQVADVDSISYAALNTLAREHKTVHGSDLRQQQMNGHTPSMQMCPQWCSVVYISDIYFKWTAAAAGCEMCAAMCILARTAYKVHDEWKRRPRITVYRSMFTQKHEQPASCSGMASTGTWCHVKCRKKKRISCEKYSNKECICGMELLLSLVLFSAKMMLLMVCVPKARFIGWRLAVEWEKYWTCWIYRILLNPDMDLINLFLSAISPSLSHFQAVRTDM